MTDEQRAHVRELVEHSMAHHHVPNIWDGEAGHHNRTVELRFTGSLGEVVFADAYGLARPTRSFGATDGQDFGKDFVIPIDGRERRVDVKSMGRHAPRLRANYVLNISSRQLHRPDGITDLFFHVSLSPRHAPDTALLVGYVAREDLADGRIGELFEEGTVRVRGDGTTFRFYSDTYEVVMSDFTPPPPTVLADVPVQNL